MGARGCCAVVSVAMLAGACVRPYIAVPTESIRDCRRVVPDAEVAITWQREVEPDDHAALDAWCAAVGPVVVIRQPTNSVPDTAAKVPLTVVSWNVHVGGGDLPAFVAALRAGTLSHGRPVRHFVILMQEALRASASVPTPMPAFAAGPSRIDAAPPAGAREDIVTQARALGLALYYVPQMRNGDDAHNGVSEDRGNAILSTLPLSDFTAIELPYSHRRRVGITATVQYGAGTGNSVRLRVSSLHLDAGGGPGRLWLFSSGFRARQARSFLTALNPAEPTVLGSDLNTWSEGPREPAYQALHAWFAQTPSPKLEPTFAFPWFRLDYVLYRLPDGWRTETWRVPSRFGSDHHPLIGQLTPPPHGQDPAGAMTYRPGRIRSGSAVAW